MQAGGRRFDPDHLHQVILVFDGVDAAGEIVAEKPRFTGCCLGLALSVGPDDGS